MIASPHGRHPRWGLATADKHWLDLAPLSTEFGLPYGVGVEAKGRVLGMEIYGAHVVTSVEGYGLEIYEIDADAPSIMKVGEYALQSIGDMVLDGTRLYVTSAKAGLEIIDLTDPAQPLQIGGFDLGDRQFNGLILGANDLVFATTQAGLLALDVSDPSSITEIGRSEVKGSYPGPQGIMGYAIERLGDILYVNMGSYGIAVVDVSDPRDIKDLGGVNLDAMPWGFSPREMLVVDDMLVVSTSRSELILFDLSDPQAPKFEGQLEIPGRFTDLVRMGSQMVIASGWAGLIGFNPSALAEAPVFPTARSETPVPLPVEPEADNRLFLPWLSTNGNSTSTAPPDPSFEETFFSGGSTEAVLVHDNRAYVSVGSTIAAYDISEPGKAHRLGQSDAVWGRIVHMAMGDGLLFATSRPDFDQDAFERQNPDWDGDLSKLPPWTVLNVFEIEGDIPVFRSQVVFDDLDEEKIFYSSGLAAHGKMAYVPLVVSVPGSRESVGEYCNYYRQEQEVENGNCGFAILDASQPESPQIHGFHRTLGRVDGIRELNGNLYIHYLQNGSGVPESEFDVTDGLLGLGLSKPTKPDYLGYFGSHYFDAQRPPTFMTAFGDRVYQTHPQSILQTFEIDEAGRPSLFGLDDPDDWRGAERMSGRENSLAWHGLRYLIDMDAKADRLLVLTIGVVDEGEDLAGIDQQDTEYGAHLGLLDVSEPLTMTLADSLTLGGIDLELGLQRAHNFETLSDRGSELDLSPDGRAFLAAGDHSMLIEISTEDDVLAEAGRYAELGKVDCAAGTSEQGFLRRELSDQMSILGLADGGAPAIKASMPISTGLGSCAMAVDGDELLAAVEGGVQHYSLANPLAPAIISRYDFEYSIADMILAGDHAYVAAGGDGVYVLDLDADPTDAIIGHLGSPAQSVDLAFDPLIERLYVAEGPAGISIIDASDPTSLREAGFIQPGGHTQTLRLSAGRLYVYSQDFAARTMRLSVYDAQSAERLDLQILAMSDTESGSSSTAGLDISADGRTILVSDGTGVRRFERPASGEKLIDHGRIETSGPIKSILAGETAAAPWLGIVESGGLSLIEDVR